MYPASLPSGSLLLSLGGRAFPGIAVPTAGLTVRRLGHGLEDLVDDLIGADSLDVGIEVGEDAMAEHGPQDGTDVAGADSPPAVEVGAGLGCFSGLSVDKLSGRFQILEICQVLMTSGGSLRLLQALKVYESDPNSLDLDLEP